MVGMVTRASNNHISWSGVGGKEKNINNLGVTVLRKLSMNWERRYTGAAGKISDH